MTCGAHLGSFRRRGDAVGESMAVRHDPVARPVPAPSYRAAIQFPCGHAPVRSLRGAVPALRSAHSTLALMKPLRRVAVLGAGTMGSRIAAHFANAGFPVDLLDVVLPDMPKRNAAALAGIENAARQKPTAFYTDAAKALIAPGNFEDDLDRVKACDWIIEAVAENLEIKRALWTKVAALRKPGTIVSTNTSGIPLAHIT